MLSETKPSRIKNYLIFEIDLLKLFKINYKN